MLEQSLSGLERRKQGDSRPGGGGGGREQTVANGGVKVKVPLLGTSDVHG